MTSGQEDPKASGIEQDKPPKNQPTDDYVRIHINTLIYTYRFSLPRRMDALVEDLVSFFHNYRSCEHRVVPCSRSHQEDEQVLICNTELAELRLDRVARQQQPRWCEHWEWTGRSWKCQAFVTSPVQQFAPEGMAYCPWLGCGAKKP